MLVIPSLDESSQFTARMVRSQRTIQIAAVSSKSKKAAF